MSMREYRPIACCNVLCKGITGILVSRKKSLLPGLIASTQTAFVTGRNLVDNILLLHDLVQRYHKDEGEGGIAKKINLQKAYDMLECECMWTVM